MEYFKNLGLENIQGETWVDITNYPYYMCSNFGRVKSLPKEKVRDKVGNFLTKERILRQKITKWGYPSVTLYKDGKHLFKTVHRLIISAFLINTEGKPQINHKNGIKTDNRIYNLEWVTASENMLHSIHVLNRKIAKSFLGRTNEKHPNSLPILCITTNIYYPSVSEASRQLNIPTTNISKVMKGKRNHAKGLVFKYALN